MREGKGERVGRESAPPRVRGGVERPPLGPDGPSRVEYANQESPASAEQGALELPAAVVDIVAAGPAAIANVAKATAKVKDLFSKDDGDQALSEPDDGGFLDE